MMRRATAAAYCELSVAGFEREIVAARLPTPIVLDGREHWCRAALDKALDIITGHEPVADYREELKRRYA
jgi:hypothetical protein